MAKAVQQIILSASRDIPFNKLMLSQSNVRRLKAGVSIEGLADDIARRGLLQSLNVRPVLDTAGTETGIFEIPAGGRRYRALERLVKQKRLSKTAPIPCIVHNLRGEISAEEDSLAENVQRIALHPLDQFRAFKTLRDQGAGEEEIAARFFIATAVVKQRLRLASVSEKLLGIYAEDGMTLEQLMAFTVTSDHARQEQVWEAMEESYNKEPYLIRRQLTESAVRASARRAQFVGLDAYEAAGGVVLRDLFEEDGGGWLQDVALLDRLATAKLATEAEKIATEGWKWIEVAVDFQYGHARHLRRLDGVEVELTPDEQATFDALTAEQAKLESEYEGADELPDEVDARLGEIEEALAAFDSRPVRYEPAEIARAGVFVSIDADGQLAADRGYLRPEHEPMQVGSEDLRDGETGGAAETVFATAAQRTVITIGGDQPEDDGDDDT
ncbi:MAG: ParB/RepB/Spo0J family partition protein, partial [Reyranella sp.]